MELDESKKFVLYTIGTGFLLILLACILQFCLVPGSDCRIPFFTSDGEKSYVYDESPEFDLEDDTDYQAVINTSKGPITIDLYEEKAPLAVNNFVFLATDEYYDEVLFHLVDKDKVMQTGDRNSLDKDSTNNGLGGPGYTFKDEVNWDSIDIPIQQRESLVEAGFETSTDLVSNRPKKYAILMANAGTGSTNGSQFFIVMMPEDDSRYLSLRGWHTVFGEVIDGFEVVDEINEVKVEDESNPGVPSPMKDIEIEYIDVIEISTTGVNVNGDKSGRTSDTHNVDL